MTIYESAMLHAKLVRLSKLVPTGVYFRYENGEYNLGTVLAYIECCKLDIVPDMGWQNVMKLMNFIYSHVKNRQ